MAHCDRFVVSGFVNPPIPFEGKPGNVRIIYATIRVSLTRAILTGAQTPLKH